MPRLDFTTEDLIKACEALKAKTHFSPGFDKMTPDAARTWLKINGDRLCNQLNGGKYHVLPALGFNTAKLDGSYRKLSKLTAIDTIIQTVLINKLREECEKRFSQYSYAYQKGKGTGAALRQYCVYGMSFPFAAKIDLRSCFDNIDFSILEQALSRFFFQRKTVMLLMAFAKMPVIADGELTERKKGILQGAPISGMLCNIYFHCLDQRLEADGVPYIRYADDIVVFGETMQRVFENKAVVCAFLEKELRLKVHPRKSRIDAAENLSFLGHTFLRDKNGVLVLSEGEQDASAYYEWHRNRPLNHRNSMDILCTGILRQKDYSALFESAVEKTMIPLETLDRINIFSNVIFDSGFLEKAMNAGVFVNVFNRNDSLIGRFVPSAPIRAQELIYKQLMIYNDTSQRLAYAREFDLASVHNLRLNIRYHNKQHENEMYVKALETINRLFAKMKRCDQYNELLMTEAEIRALYYGCFDLFIQNKQFAFHTRSRQPPLNEVNSMISFGNVVLYNYIATELYKSSLDIRIGFLHATNKRMESLNLDIAEVFRPLLVDRIVFSAINLREIDPSSFIREDNGGIYLNENGKRIILRKFYEKLNSTLLIDGKHFSYAMLIQTEIQKLTKSIKTGEKYKAFRQVR